MEHRTLTLSAVGVIAAGLAVSSSARVALADHIPGHSDDDPVFPVPIPGREHFDGGLLFVTALGPPGGSEIHNVAFDITYVSDGATPASELLIVVGLAVGEENPIYVETHVDGTALGFGSGAGTFQGTFETSELNGVAVAGFFPPYSIVNIAVGSVDGGIEGSGYFVNSFINFDLAGTAPGDLDGDGSVGTADLLQLLAAWGPCADCDECPEDLDGDCAVATGDLLVLLSNWG